MEAIKIGTQQLEELSFKNMEHDPEGEARILLSHTLSPNAPTRSMGAFLMSLSRRHLTKEEFENYLAFIKRRANYEPIEYITGQVNFFGRTFQVNNNVLIPRVDSEVLIETVLDKVLPQLDQQQQQNIHLMELGVGSGCLLLTLMLEIEKKGYTIGSAIGLDKSEAALRVAHLNALNLLTQQQMARLTLSQHDMLTHEPALTTVKQPIDLLISNPPYIPSSVVRTELDRDVNEYEPHLALDGGIDGMDFYRILCNPTLLTEHYHLKRHGGFVALEIGIGQSLHENFAKYEKNHSKTRENEITLVKVCESKDLADIPRVLLFKTNTA